ncbi:Bacterial regulatory helix-turn-helix protein, lysR family [compost metagenome]
MFEAGMLSQVRDLDLQLLRLFVCVVESGGFSCAQDELGIGQSTISTQMAKLETRPAFLLSGAHIGYLPQHIAAPREARGLLRALAPEQLGFRVQFHLASHRGHQPSEAQLAFVEDLLGAFG